MENNLNGEMRGYNVVTPAGPVALDPYCGLAAGMLKNAAKEAQAGDLSAVEWLLGDLAAWLADLLELDAVGMQRVASQWLVSNCFLVLEDYGGRDGQ